MTAAALAVLFIVKLLSPIAGTITAITGWFSTGHRPIWAAAIIAALISEAILVAAGNAPHMRLEILLVSTPAAAVWGYVSRYLRGRVRG
jgi:hypothetical protein